MGMAPLALYLAQAGFAVSGEDDALAEPMRARLESAGIGLGAAPEDSELLVCSAAIGPGHPARTAAQARGVPVARRGELLAEVVRNRKLVAVCGSHGKTTTTALLISALRRAKFPAGYILGGLPADGSPPAAAGSNEWIVAELDESDGTIDHFAPEIAVVVNMDWDHPDRYARPEEMAATFAALLRRTRGAVLVHDSCAMSAGVAALLARKPLRFGRTGDFPAEIAEEGPGRTTLRLGGRFPIAAATVRAGGEFNAANATAALAAASLMGVTLDGGMLEDFAGVMRRQTVLGEAGGATVLEDYAHHPAEIRALLASLRPRLAGSGRLMVVFQPHRYSRSAQFRGEFAAALALADRVSLLEVYGAGEEPVPEGRAADLAAEVRRSFPALPLTHQADDDAGTLRALVRDVRPGDLVVFVGAGDINRKARDWLGTWRSAPAPASRWDGHLAALQAETGEGARLRREEPLGARTTLKVGGAARIYAEPASRAELQALLRAARARQLDVFPLGRGSNLIVPDEGVDGLVVALNHEAWAGFTARADGRIQVGAGLRLKNLCGLAAKAGLTGFEFLEGIPGSVGGALRMNAGAMGGWMFDVVDEIEVMSPAGEVRVLPRSALHVGYRHCAELEDGFALGALLRPVAQSAAGEIGRQIDVYRRKRQESQPREPSAGCVFKNPPGDSAGRLIDACGLKGERVGDAEVSRVHANFIVNRGGATGAEVLELVRRVRARVREAQGVELQPEVLLFGRAWEDVL
jgi:UDP-N-acetylenolpyruvoylglucosamine reductase